MPSRTESVTGDEFRTVHFNTPQVSENVGFCGNKIRTALCARLTLAHAQRCNDCTVALTFRGIAFAMGPQSAS